MTRFDTRTICLFGLGLLGAAAPAQAALTISVQPTRNVVCDNQVCTASAADAVLNVGDLTALLAEGDLQVVSGRAAHDIVVSSDFLATVQGRNFTLDAARSIRFEHQVGIAGNGVVTLVTNDGGTKGTLWFGSRGRLYLQKDSYASLVINGVTYTTLRSIADLSEYIGATPDGHFAFVQDYDALHDGSYGFAPVTTTLSGTVEGLGNTISNFSVYGTGKLPVALFSAVGGSPSGVVQNLRLKDIVIRTTGKSSIGGLASSALGALFINDSVSGTIIAGGPSVVGGLLGSGDSAGVVGCSSSVAISAPKASTVGDLVGSLAYGGVQQSFATGSVSGGSGSTVGQVVGQSYTSTVVNSYATGRVSVTGGSAGGLLGSITGGSIQDSYAAGPVAGRLSSYAGGLAGSAAGANRLVPAIVDGYWDTDTTGQAVGVGDPGPLGSETGIGLSTSALTSSLPAGFDPSVWAQAAGVNAGLPYLIGVTPN